MRKTLMVVCSFATLATAGGAQPARPSGGARDTAASDSLFSLGPRAARRPAVPQGRQGLRVAGRGYPTTARAGDALYWQAWGLYQLGKDNGSKTDLGQALDVLSQYNSNYGKNTQMANDATELYAQIRARRPSSATRTRRATSPSMRGRCAKRRRAPDRAPTTRCAWRRSTG